MLPIQNDFERKYTEYLVRQSEHAREARHAGRNWAFAWAICGGGIEYVFDCGGWALGIGFVAAAICWIASIFDANMPHYYDDNIQNQR